ncbi:hypothetical protein ACFVXC_29275 [Streptomyces sp. NPDC058257]|uniref:hypothetical protein n=1 Tax=Streptomyces sp. NPDC058257 TaxID=3346409 RepID=UPI0036F0421B
MTTQTPQWYGSEPIPLGSRLPAPALIDGLTRAMDDIAFPMSPASLRPVVLPEESYQEMFTAAAALLRLLRRTLLEAAPTAAGRIAALGADEEMYPLFVDSAAEEDFATCIARPDVMVDATGPKFVEFNIGAGIGGVVDTSLNSAAWIEAYGGRELAPFTGPDPLAVRDQIFVRAVRELGVRPGVAIVGTARDLNGSRTTRYYDVQVDSLRSRGLEAEFFEPEDLLAGLGLPGRPRYDIGLRHFTIPEWRGHAIDLAPVRTALDAGCTLIATQTAYLISNKKVLGWVSEGQPWMSARDRETVERYLPWTRVVSGRSTHWRGAKRFLPELLLDSPEEFVLKPAIGMKAQDVLVGRHCDRELWDSTVSRAVEREDHIVQEYVRPAPYSMEFAEAEGTGSYEAEVFPVFSPYVFDDRPGGCMVRYLPPGRHGVVSIHGHGALPTVALARR